jgi:putative effector of murein hydrolase LrgA (UPF0299 family)
MVILQANLIHYHRKQELAFRSRHILGLPFSFIGPSFWTTATAWLLIYTALLTVALCIAAVIGAAQAFALLPSNWIAIVSVGIVSMLLTAVTLSWIIFRLLQRADT